MRAIRTLLILLVICLLGACQPAEPEHMFVARVLQVHENALEVEPAPGSRELSSADRIVVYIGEAQLTDAKDNPLQLDNFSPNDSVSIEYDGMIAESYPAQIHTCYRIVKK